MTQQELDERIEQLWDNSGVGRLTRSWYTEEMLDLKISFQKQQRQLIRDCIEAVTPEPIPLDAPYLGYPNDEIGEARLKGWRHGTNDAVDVVRVGTKELLG